MGLTEYRRKRDFAKTPEPAGGAARATGKGKPSFVIQKHAARRAHYDFRLEMDGVLKSWAVPKGPSLDPQAKRLAVHVEDHPLEYGGFEGVIPAGEYGGGTVMLWDRGTWEPYTDAAAGYAKGDLKFVLHGAKLHGRWALVRMKPRAGETADNWLLIKERDEIAMPGSDDAVLAREPLSVATGRDMDAIARDADRVWSAKTGEVSEKPRPKAKKASRAPSPVDPSKLPGAKAVKAPPDVAPQLARSADVAPAGDDWLHEIKFDGYRILATIAGGKAVLRSRNALDWTAKFPELAAALSALPVETAVLDGEVAHIDADGVSRFGGLQDDLSTGNTAALVYMAFDLPYLDGWDLRAAPLEARKALLQALLAAQDAPTIRYSDHHVGKGADFFAAAGAHGLEGIIAKRRDAPYRAGRSPAWLKIKTVLREEFVVVGFSDPEGSRVGFGSLLLGYHTRQGKLVYAGRVGTGYSDKVLTALRTRLEKLEQKAKTVTLPPEQPWRDVHWVKPRLVVEVGFSEWTRDKLVRAASFIGVREDKGPAEVVLDPKPGSRAPQVAAAAAPPAPRAAIARDGSATVGGVRITHADRVVYPDQGVTKLAVAEYYAAVADWILPHVANRPLSLLRCPEGITGEKFFQKHPWGNLSDAIKRIEIAEKDGGSETHMWIEDATGLLSLVQMGVLEIHPWGSRIQDVEKPDRLTFDLDPDEALAWPRVVEAAFEVRDVLADLGLTSFLKTTGGKGLHVVVPIRPTVVWDDAKAFCKALVEALAGEHPQRYTATVAKRARHGRIFIDYLRNGRGATAVAAYSTRARPGTAVSAPVTWQEAERGIRPDQFTIANVPQRLRDGPDPWADMRSLRQSVTAAARRKLKL